MLFCIVDILGATHLSSGILMFMSYYREQFVRGVQNKENSDGKATWFRKNMESLETCYLNHCTHNPWDNDPDCKYELKSSGFACRVRGT